MIAFDVDGVVFNSINPMLTVINRELGTTYTAADCRSYGLSELGVDHDLMAKAVEHMCSLPSLQPYPGAAFALDCAWRLLGGPLLFITSREDIESARRQLEALEWRRSECPEFIVVGGGSDKTDALRLAGVDVFLEDCPLHLERYQDNGIGVGLMLRPWNEDCSLPNVERFQSWDEFLYKRVLSSWRCEQD